MKTITCPVCSNPIAFDIYGLMQGEKFTCSRCNAVISLSQESSALVKDTMEKLEKLNHGKPVPANQE